MISSAPVPPDADKGALRRQILAGRDTASHDPSIAEHLLDQAAPVLEHVAAVCGPSASGVAGYWPIRGEMDVRPLLGRFSDLGYQTCLPVVIARGAALAFRAWAPGDALEEGPFKTRHPLTDASTVVPSVLLIPLVGFDRRGYRLGYGGGFYDRTLKALRREGPVLAVGIAHAMQEVPRVPNDVHDQPLDWVITERETLCFSARA